MGKTWKLSEMAKDDLSSVERYADKQLNPADVEFTKHFFDRVKDPRNIKPISSAELVGFFKRLARNKKQFIQFLKQYKQFVVTDNRTNINIPFVRNVNRLIAKTIMRKRRFTTPNARYVVEAMMVDRGTEPYVVNIDDLTINNTKYAPVQHPKGRVDVNRPIEEGERDYKKEYEEYHSKPKQKKRRAERNHARRKMEKEGKVRKGDGKDVHHKNGNTSDNNSKNLQVMSKSKNRSIKESALKINKGFVFRAKNNFDKVKSGLKYIVKDISGSIGNMVITVSQMGKDTPIKLKVRSMPEFYRNVMVSENHQNTLYKEIMMGYMEETIKKVDGKYVVYPKKGGKRLGTHDTLSAAKKQLAAIEISKSK